MKQLMMTAALLTAMAAQAHATDQLDDLLKNRARMVAAVAVLLNFAAEMCARPQDAIQRRDRPLCRCVWPQKRRCVYGRGACQDEREGGWLGEGPGSRQGRSLGGHMRLGRPDEHEGPRSE